MSRVIKFRHFFSHTNVMTAGITVQTLLMYDDGKGDHWKHATWMQYTGEVDKNKVEIYEGDIVRITDVFNEDSFVTDVVYQGSAFVVMGDNMFSSGDADLQTVGWAMEAGHAFEVIGNIYQHPHLLKNESTGATS